MTPEEKQRAAIRLQNDPLFAAILEELKQDTVREWATTAPSQDDQRAVCYHKHTALVQLEMEVKNLAG